MESRFARQPGPEIDVEELAQFMERPDIQVVDVREDWEYRRGHVPGVVPLPLSQIAARLAEIPTDRPLAIICEHGERSLTVADFLVRRGLAAVSVRGGTSAWVRSGRAIERPRV